MICLVDSEKILKYKAGAKVEDRIENLGWSFNPADNSMIRFYKLDGKVHQFKGSYDEFETNPMQTMWNDVKGILGIP